MSKQDPKLQELASRLSSLSPDKRAVFERLLREKGIEIPPLPPSASQATGPLAGEAPSAVGGGDAIITEQDLASQEASVADVKRRVKRLYDGISAQLNTSGHAQHSRFLQLGYASTGAGDHSVVELPARCLNKNCIRLVCELVGAFPIAGRQVLDVGCGRGGTLYVLNEYFRPAATTGLDLSTDAISFCRAGADGARTRFLQGDAENLPFGDGEFDVVTNVESSHNYPNIQNFYRHVHRVLKPGGWFLYTDLLSTPRWEKGLAELAALGFVTRLDRDITLNVMRSCDETGATHQRSFSSENDRVIMGNFLGLQGSETYESMKRGSSSYRVYHFQKPAAPQPS